MEDVALVNWALAQSVDILQGDGKTDVKPYRTVLDWVATVKSATGEGLTVV